MRPELINRESDVWVYEPDKHKNKWRGHSRRVPLGPKAIAILKPFMERGSSEYLFSPAEAEQERNANRAIERNRTTPVYPCELRRREKRLVAAKKNNPRRPKGDCYNPNSYRRAIEYGLVKLNRLRLKGSPDAKPIEQWTPYQLRHTFATEMRRKHGVEAAQLGLGHARTNIVDIYAEKNLAFLKDLAKEHG